MIVEELNDVSVEEGEFPFDPVESLSPDNVRLLTFANGMNIITQIVDIQDGDIIALLPMELMMEFDGDSMAMISYELNPYLDHLHPFDVNEPLPVFFNEMMVVSITVPSVHLFRNYYYHLKVMQEVLDEELGRVRETTETIH